MNEPHQRQLVDTFKCLLGLTWNLDVEIECFENSVRRVFTRLL